MGKNANRRNVILGIIKAHLLWKLGPLMLSVGISMQVEYMYVNGNNIKLHSSYLILDELTDKYIFTYTLVNRWRSLP